MCLSIRHPPPGDVLRGFSVPFRLRPAAAARFDVRRDKDRLRVTADSPHPWRLRIGGPGGMVHTDSAGRATTDFPHEV